MSKVLLRQLGRVLPALDARTDDTIRRLAYVAPRGVGFADVFHLPKDWHRALPISGGVPALSERTARQRIADLIAQGFLEVSGRMARLKLPATQSIFEGVRVARRKASVLWTKAMATASSLAMLGDMVRQFCGGSAANDRRMSGGRYDASPCFLIEDDVSVADGGSGAGHAPGAASASVKEDAASDFGYAIGPEKAEGWEDRANELVFAAFPSARPIR